MAVLIARPKIALKTIVVKTDFSPASEVALQYAVALGHYYGAKIELVYGTERKKREPDECKAALGGVPAEEMLRRQIKQCGDLECSSWFFTGTPLEVVDRLLSFEKVDLVVVGTQDVTGVKKVSAGAASEHLFRKIHCPVLAVGPAVAAPEPGWYPKRMLLTTDLQSDESTAAKCAALLAREHESQLALLYVAHPTRVPFPVDDEISAKPYFQTRLRELMSYKPELDYPADYWVKFAEDPVESILQVAREKAIDLLVMSVHREEPWGFHFVHHAYRIVSESPCPVLITQREL
jgi:nucleotide-binding universal stress UspA family protein